MKRISKFVAFFLTLCFLVSMFSVPVHAENVQTEQVQSEMLKGFDKVAENSNILLYINNSTSDIALVDKSSNSLWWSNPVDRNSDTFAKGTFKMNLSSHILLEYVDEKGQKFMANDYTGSVQKKGMKAQKIQNGVKVTYYFDKEKMTIPVQYTLNKDYLEAKIILSEVEEKGGYELTSISLLPYFGAGGEKAQGYMMIPDGAGALINFNNGKTVYSDYSENIYGRDNILSKSVEDVKKDKISLPVYGIKNGNNGIIAVITEGDSVGVLNASVSGRSTSYNNVYCEFEYRAFDSVIMREREGTAKDISTVAQTAASVDSFSINYYPLQKQDSDYPGMAKRYQRYLVEEKGLKSSVKDSDVPFYVNTFGGIEKKKYIFGIPINTVEKLTTYRQAKELLEELKDLGVKNPVLRYQSWSEEDIYGKVPSNVDLESKLGSRKEFSSLIEYSNTNNIDFYPNADLANMLNRGNGFSAYKNAAQTVSRAPALQYLFSISHYFKRGDVRPWYLVSPQFLPEIAKDLNQGLSKMDIQGVSSNTLGNLLYSDYSKKGIDRNRAQALNEEALKALNIKKLLESANAYSIPYASHIINTPFSSSKYDIFDEEVPFYQMVIHGYVPYSLESVNLVSNEEDMFLKTLETGSSQLYSWIANDSTLLKGTKLDYLYSGNYKSWIKSAAEDYKKINEVLRSIQSKRIVNHKKLLENVNETTYENGVSVVVNYNNKDVTIKGRTIKGKGYAVYEGGK